MKTYIVLAAGISLLASGLVAAMLAAKGERRRGSTSVWYRIYVSLLGVALAISALLCMNSLIERVSVDAYVRLYDDLTFVLLGAILCGVILIFYSRRFVLSHVACVLGAVLALGEFLIR